MARCTEAWCTQTRPYCEALVSACAANATLEHEQVITLCEDVLGTTLRTGVVDVPTAIAELDQCATVTTGCTAVRECQRAMMPQHGCPVSWPGDGAIVEASSPGVCSYEMPCGCAVSCTRTDEGTWSCPAPLGASCAACDGLSFSACAATKAVWTSDDDEADRCEGTFDPGAETIPQGAVLSEGDVPACVTCAFDHCANESQLCFVDALTTPGCFPSGGDGDTTDPDCCAPYRTCVAACQELHYDDVTTLVLCVSSACDPYMPAGHTQFDTYATCMANSCAGCL